MKKVVLMIGVIAGLSASAYAVLFTGGTVTVANTSLTYALSDGVPANTSTLMKFTRLNLEAPSTNSGTLYYGTSSTVNATTGKALNAGDTRTIVDNDRFNRYYVTGTSAGDVLKFDWNE